MEKTHREDMDHRGLIVLLWSSGFFQGLQTEKFEEIQDIRLVEGSSRCSGVLQVKHQGVWTEVDDFHWDLKLANEVCRHLNCGSVVRSFSTLRPLSSGRISLSCLQSESTLRKCLTKKSTVIATSLEIFCSDSVRLVNGTRLCSGRLEVKSNQSWSPVCEDDFNQQDAEVVCREVGCGAPSVLQGALYGDVEAPMWTCSSGKAVGLTCSEPDDFRLMGGSSRCAGELKMYRYGEWIHVDYRTSGWNLKTADVVCRQLDCGSVISTEQLSQDPYTPTWWIKSGCLQPKSAVRECILTKHTTSTHNLHIKCSDSVRLVNGKSLCSGRLEVKSNQSNQLWSSVCEDDFDQKDAEVVCRELGCGAPLDLDGKMEDPMWKNEKIPNLMWTKEFQCVGNESALLDCGRSGSERDTCSPGKAVGLTCSEPDEVRLVGGASHCVGRLEIKHKGDWGPVDGDYTSWDLMSATVVCRQVDCGSALSVERVDNPTNFNARRVMPSCGQSASTIRECVLISHQVSFNSLHITCSDSVRLVNGPCSGRLEVRSNQSNQSWSSVCEADFDQQDAEVVCRELGCGVTSVLQGAVYGEVVAPVWTDEFQCGGNESALLDCRSSASTRNTCSPVELTCSDPDNIRLVGEASRCAGTLEMKNQGEWRPVADWDSEWDHKSGAAVCRQLGCGSVVSTNIIEDLLHRSVWWIKSPCLQSASSLLKCVTRRESVSLFSLSVICSDLLAQPNISLSPSTDGVSNAKQQGLQMLMGYNFTITCSIEPQYPGGSFQVTFSTSNTAQTYTLPAVNHSAHFLFPAASPAHQGEYRCVYHLYAFSHNFSSESQPFYLTISASTTHLIIRVVVILVVNVVCTVALYYYCKATRGQKSRQKASIEMDYPGGADGLLGEDAGAQRTE